MKFNREKLSDCFDSISLAHEIRQQLGLKAEPAPLEYIASEIGIFNIREENLNSIEGALVVPDGKLEGEIILNANQYPERKRFTLAHELGHFVHPLHHPDIEGRFNCSSDDIFKPFKREQLPIIEDQANEFASELLVPVEHLSPLIDLTTDLNFEAISTLCSDFNVSTAFILRKIQPLSKSPLAFIFSLNGTIRYIHCENFPYLKVWSKNSLPENTVSSGNHEDNTISAKIQVDHKKWLKKPCRGSLFEQIFVQENGYRITMLNISHK